MSVLGSVMLAAADQLAPRQSGAADFRALPRGRHPLPREVVLGSQRERLLHAMARVCAEEGYRRATVPAVVARAGVSSKAFYELFRDREECFLAAYDAAVVRLLGRVIAAYGNAGRAWPERLRAALEALLLSLESEPTAARVCFVEVMVAGPPARARYESTIRVLAGLVQADRGEPGGREQPPASTAVWVVHGVALAIRDQILAGGGGRLSELLEGLLYSALVPQLGQEQALRVAGRRGA